MPHRPPTPPFAPTFQPASPDQLKRKLAEKLLLPPDQVDAITAELGGGVWDLAWSVATVTDVALLASLRDSLLEILNSGGTLRDWRDMLDELGWRSPLGAWHEETIFRTTLGSVMEAERFDQLTDSEFVDYLVFDAVDDDRICEECLALDGKTWSRDEFPGALWPPLHFSCFPGDVRVAANVVAGTRMLYAGQVIELETRRGNRLTVTPNHPIATPAGFIAARDLHKGAEVLTHCTGAEKMITSADAGPALEASDDQHEPARIDEVFGALVHAFGVRTAEVGGHDLHGDAQGGNGHIEVAMADRVLRGCVAGERGGDGEDLRLETADAGDGSGMTSGDVVLDRVGADRAAAGALHPLGGGQELRSSPASFLAAHDSPTARRVCCAELTLDSAAVELEYGPLNALRVGATSRLDAALTELSAQGVAADAGFFRELLERNPALVALDEIVDVRKSDWSGHVFDLQSTTGVIVAGGLLVSNCRCSVIPADAGDLANLKADMHQGPPPLDHVAQGFDAPPSVNGLTTIVQQALVDRLHAAGWPISPPVAPGRAA